MISMELITAFCAILSLCGVIFKYAVIRPLETSIDALKLEIVELRRDRERLHLLEVQLAEINQRVRSNQHRIDKLEEVPHEN
ncbi:MAG: hypothetical protein IJS69_04950 [Selenomonadaceae bacterium]|nr:hypothetical protein [Selenomonadaceae bacterium]